MTVRYEETTPFSFGYEGVKSSMKAGCSPENLKNDALIADLKCFKHAKHSYNSLSSS